METRSANRPAATAAKAVLRSGPAGLCAAATLWIAGAAAASPLAPAQAETTATVAATPDTQAEGPWLTLPDEPMGRSWASVSKTTAPWDYLSKPASDPAGDGTWNSWANSLAAVGARTPAAPSKASREATARLMHFAAKDRRPEDAYAWAKSLGAGDPEGVAGTLPYLFPGVPFGAPLGTGGRPAALPAGTLLSPILAAPKAPDAPMGIVWREAKARGLQVGGATFDMELKIDNTGVVVDFDEVTGTETKVRLQLPVPEGYRLKALFIDWEKVPLPEGADPLRFDWAAAPIDVTVKERESTYSIFARIAPLTSSLPASPKNGMGLPSSMLEGGLEIRIAPDDDAPWKAIAAAWSKATGVSVRTTVATPGAAGSPISRGIRGTVLDFTRCLDPGRLRRQITAAIEARIRAGS